MGRNHLCEQAIPEDPAHLLHQPCGRCRPSGLSFGFPKLSPSRRQLDYVLLARPPLYSPCGFRVRLACLIHAANVRSVPGSNPSLLVCPLRRSRTRGSRPRCGLPARTPASRPGPCRSLCAHTLFSAATRNVKDRLTRARSRREGRGTVASIGTPGKKSCQVFSSAVATSG